ncbi:MAG: lytic transglycosylase domain-containing protein [Rubrimonas sp.]|uniref:lytic transglycosylase domain-containing protein n=1 Tax=Rubrimonas sp. TaxID=2036015 RepID=UPI002FDDE1B8
MRAALAALIALAALAGPAQASREAAPLDDPAAICLATADAAADARGIPRAVLRTLTRTETGRAKGGRLQPWPWTVNMEGKGRWFDSRAEALAYVKREMARGARSFDVGCFQINYRWHGEHFASVEEMFEPEANADYAARFLSGLFAETANWSQAAGFYHSRTPHFVQRYRARFDDILARGDPDAPFDPSAPADAPRIAAAPPPVSTRRPVPPEWRLRAAAAERSAGAVAVRLGTGATAMFHPTQGGLLRLSGGPLLRGASRALID